MAIVFDCPRLFRVCALALCWFLSLLLFLVQGFLGLLLRFFLMRKNNLWILFCRFTSVLVSMAVIDIRLLLLFETCVLSLLLLSVQLLVTSFIANLLVPYFLLRRIFDFFEVLFLLRFFLFALLCEMLSFCLFVQWIEWIVGLLGRCLLIGFRGMGIRSIRLGFVVGVILLL
jgi:hypothetical protein